MFVKTGIACARPPAARIASRTVDHIGRAMGYRKRRIARRPHGLNR
jgi:hypothetical protein